MKVLNIAVQISSWFLVLGLLGACANESDLENVELELNQKVAFTSIALEIGLGELRHDNGSFGGVFMPEIVGGGVGVIDYNNDDWPDLLFVGGGKFKGHADKKILAIRLFRNDNGNGFTEVSKEVGLSDLETYSYGVSVADYDNDGDDDFILTGLYENFLFRNDNQQFTEVGKEAGIAEYSEWSTSAIFFDADNDSWLDLIVGNYVQWTEAEDLNCLYEGKKAYCTPEAYDGMASRFYKNNGDGTFTERTIESEMGKGVDPMLDKTLGLAELDFNGDGLPDIIMANDTERDFLLVNKGEGKFEEAGIPRGVAYSEHGKARAGMGIDTGVTDSTGLISVYIGNFTDETVGVYRHGGNGLFRDRAAASRVSLPSIKTLTFGLFLSDIDLDMDLDLFTANGHVQTHINKIDQRVTFYEPPQLYLNRGDGTFDEWREEDDFEKPLLGRGAIPIDFDRDGDQDLIITENNGPLNFWRNDHVGNNYLKVSLEGSDSNRNGYGSIVRIFSGGKRQERRVHSGSSFLSALESTAHFGMAKEKSIDSLSVVWPSGIVDRITSIPSNKEIRIKEGSGSYQELSK